MKKDEIILYGLDEHKDVIDKIITEIENFEESFDIRLMLIEALTNAFKHGNKCCVERPIYLRYVLNEKNIKFEIEDSGTGFKNINIPDAIYDENLLNDSGRGLFLIKCMADKIEFKNNILIIQKYLTAKKNKAQN
ncbi:ATP-binding protein [Crassaminicella indica]|uniref:ATP-binding protein n=1 Tax=Crassaminicella indica TaxID=2855394 RepID=A0ABX8RHV3_9CLOT|nr:ATP-binding protein [Crassaminicella indica]